MSRKKERQRLKRKAAKQKQRRQLGKGPLAGLVTGRGAFTVYRTDEWDTLRQCSVFVLREEAGRRHFAGFLVDRGVAGLKDAWVLPNIPQEQFDHIVRKAGEEFKFVRTTIANARSIVAGAIRYATQWGFRLPSDLDRALKVIDGVGDWRSADVSRFVPEFAGTRADLQRRCIGQPLEEFLARTDVTFIFDERNSLVTYDEDEDVEDELDDLMDDPEIVEEAEVMVDTMRRMNDALIADITKWCVSKNLVPHPALAAAVAFKTGAVLLAMKNMTGPPEPDKPILDDATLDEMLSTYPPTTQLALRGALAQIGRYTEERTTFLEPDPPPAST
jgi:hypothetical protein